MSIMGLWSAIQNPMTSIKTYYVVAFHNEREQACFLCFFPDD